MSDRFEHAIQTCRAIQAHYGKNYFFATRFLPLEIRPAVHALYAFFRIPDEIVDDLGRDPLIIPHVPPVMRDGQLDVRAALEQWRDAWHEAYEHGDAADDVLFASAQVFHQFNIPFAYSEAFLSAMIQDTEKVRYANYEELKGYMYGSAAAVGLMMTHVMGFTDQKAVSYAEDLGYAMQLTNFLRDIREDDVERGRIYLPQDELVQFNLTDQDIHDGQVDDRFRSFMKFQIERADRLYEHANQGIKYLHPRGQFAVRVASELYQWLNRKIEEQGYNVYRGRVRTSKTERIGRMLAIWLSGRYRG